MFEAPLPSEIDAAAPKPGGLARVDGGVSIRIKARGGGSAIADLLERDGYKVRFPRGTAHPEAVIINTGGGLAGGDRVRQTVIVDGGAAATVTTQAAERVYRALDESETSLDVRLTVGGGARLDWLPQETILFDRSRLARSIDVEMAGDARLLLAETIIFGRTAMGETVKTGRLIDRWRIRRGGRLVFAETVRLEGAIAETLDRPPVAGGAHVVATALAIRPDAEDLLEPVRAALTGAACEAGASAWNGMLVIRALGRSGESVRRLLERALPVLSAAALPRVWQT